MQNQIKFALFVVFALLAFEFSVFGQEGENPKRERKVNFGYSVNPPAREPEANEIRTAPATPKPQLELNPSVAMGTETKPNTQPNATVAKAKPEAKPQSEPIASSASNTNRVEVDPDSDVVDAVNPTATTVVPSSPTNVRDAEATIAKTTREIVKSANRKSLPLTEIYRVGVDDVLYISIENAPASSAKYYTVLSDGKIDYPLAGDLLTVAGLTTEEIEDILRERIKLYENPNVSVKVREYASHSVSVSGLVEKPGKKYLEREVLPLFVIRANSLVLSTADEVVIRREKEEPKRLLLADDKTGEFLILPGDSIEFTGKAIASASPQGFYFIGNVFNKAPGPRPFYVGLTLNQVIVSEGGLRDPNQRKVVIRRANSKGLIESKEYDISKIKQGRAPDPQIQPGDTIEIER